MTKLLCRDCRHSVRTGAAEELVQLWCTHPAAPKLKTGLSGQYKPCRRAAKVPKWCPVVKEVTYAD